MDLTAVIAGADADPGIPAATELLAYADAAHAAYKVGLKQTAALAQARSALEFAVGHPGLVEAAATVATFSGIVRLADGTGIQLDDGTNAASADFRPHTGINTYTGAANTPTTPEPRQWSSVMELFLG